MVKSSNEYIVSPKLVGAKLEAGMYIKNDDNTPVTKTVYLKGYNPATAKFHTFGQTIPNSQGWAGMPMITFTDVHIGTWRMHWAIPDLSTTIQSGVADLVVTKVATPMYLTSDKTSIQKGDTVTFSGTYKANAKLQIMDVTDLLDTKIVETTCDTYKNFKVAVNLNVPVGLRKFEGKSFDLFPDKSGAVYITIHPKQVCVPKWGCIQPLNGYESDGCGHNRYNALCLPVTGCTEGTTREMNCPNIVGKTYIQKCVSGEWISVDKDTKCAEPKDEDKDKDKDKMLYYILLAVVVIMVIMIIIKKRGK